MQGLINGFKQAVCLLASSAVAYWAGLAGITLFGGITVYRPVQIGLTAALSALVFVGMNVLLGWHFCKRFSLQSSQRFTWRKELPLMFFAALAVFLLDIRTDFSAMFAAPTEWLVMLCSGNYDFSPKELRDQAYLLFLLCRIGLLLAGSAGLLGGIYAGYRRAYNRRQAQLQRLREAGMPDGPRAVSTQNKYNH